jgi:hydrogenase maturation factor
MIVPREGVDEYFCTTAWLWRGFGELSGTLGELRETFGEVPERLQFNMELAN